jgi:hypothetical protein
MQISYFTSTIHNDDIFFCFFFPEMRSPKSFLFLDFLPGVPAV